MLKSGTTNYYKLYFEHKMLTRINGEPTFATLHNLLLELREIQCLHQVHLLAGVRMFSSTPYSQPRHTPLWCRFVIPQHPGPLPQVHGATQYEITLAKTIHDEGLETFHSYQLVHHDLVQKVLDIIDTKYLSSLHNQITGQVPSDIRTLILHLFRIYDKITPHQLRTRYNTVESIKYAIEEPITIIFDAIEDLVEIGELTGIPYSAQQVVDLSNIIISKNRIFRSDIFKWMRQPEVEKRG